VDQTLKVSQSSNNKKSLEFIDSNHMGKKSDEDSKDQRKTKIIGIDQIIVSKEALVNLMNQQAMRLLKNHGYTIL
jgi:hypothetical protein